MATFLFYGDTERSPAMRHELPVPIGDPFLLAVAGDRLHVMVNSLERSRVEAAAPHAVVHDITDLGFHELRASGLSGYEIDLELAARAAAAMGVREAATDPEFPLAVADRLRADGIELRPDGAILERRRVKSAAELAGMRRAQAAAEAGMRAVAAYLRAAEIDGDRLVHDGEPVTSESVRAVLRDECRRNNAPAPADVIVASAWQGYGHDPGSGPLPANLPISVDVWPRDDESGCWADMTRTFVVGEISDLVRARADLVRSALERARDAIRPGVSGRELHEIVCDLFEDADYRTQRTGPGDDPDEGFQFSLGHGVGLAVHEDPALGLAGHAPLVAGDVVALEPGIYDRETGEVRFEDLVLVTEDGSETLTDYPYDLTP